MGSFWWQLCTPLVFLLPDSQTEHFGQYGMALLGELGRGLVLSLITPNRPSPGQVGRAEPSHVEWNTEGAFAGNNRQHTCPRSFLQQTRKRRGEQSAQRETRSLWYGDHCSRRFGFTCRLLSLHTRDVCKELHVHWHVPERCALPRRTLHVLRFSFKL